MKSSIPFSLIEKWAEIEAANSVYGRYKCFLPDEIFQIYIARCIKNFSSYESIYSLLDGELGKTGYAVCCYIDEDSLHFNKKMGRLHFCFADNVSKKEKKAALTDVLHKAREAGFQHISSSVDTGDSLSLSILASLGFHVLDTKLTYIAHQPPSGLKRNSLYPVRRLASFDSEEAESIVSSVIFPSRYSNDPLLDPELVAGFYVKWLQSYFDNESAYAYVATSTGRAIAVGGFSPVSELAPLSLGRLLGNSLLACRPGFSGGGFSLLAKGLSDALIDYSAVELSTSYTNKSMRRLLEFYRCHLAGGSHSLRWMV